jgi:hypothetical protein
VGEGSDIRLPRCCCEDVARTRCRYTTVYKRSTIKFELRKLDPPAPSAYSCRSFAKKISHSPHYSSTRRRTHTECCCPWRTYVAENGAIASISLPHRVLCSLTHRPRIASASAPFPCTACSLQAVRTARCTMDTGGPPSQSRSQVVVELVGIFLPAVARDHVRSLFCYLICRDHSALALMCTACSLYHR